MKFYVFPSILVYFLWSMQNKCRILNLFCCTNYFTKIMAMYCRGPPWTFLFYKVLLSVSVARALVSPTPMSSRNCILEPYGRWHATICLTCNNNFCIICTTMGIWTLCFMWHFFVFLVKKMISNIYILLLLLIYRLNNK